MVTENTADQEQFIERACELAKEAAEKGDGPYGSLLVVDGEIIMEERNREQTDNDIAQHPELTLARRAHSELEPDVRAKAVMYTSTEPCPMCSTGMVYAGLDAVVYSTSGKRASEMRGVEIEGIPSSEVFDRYDADIDVIGPVLPERGDEIHQKYSQE
jgi:tRNA(Arg) A34 adenosine deaminase TadA